MNTINIINVTSRSMAFFSCKNAREYASKSQKFGRLRVVVEEMEAFEAPASKVKPPIEPEAEGDGDAGLIQEQGGRGRQLQ